MRQSSPRSLDISIEREIDSKYGDVKKVANNLDSIDDIVTIIDNGKLDAVSGMASEITNISDTANLIQNLTATAYTTTGTPKVSLDVDNSTIQFGMLKGEDGKDGKDGLMPDVSFGYDTMSGRLYYYVESYRPTETLAKIKEW